jgi:hypothetical protein
MMASCRNGSRVTEGLDGCGEAGLAVAEFRREFAVEGFVK